MKSPPPDVFAEAATAWLEAFGAETADPAALGAVFAPTRYKQVLDQALALGRAAGRMGEAMRVVAEGEQRLRALHRRIGLTRPERGGAGRPRVVVLDGLEPLAVAGRWVPDLVVQAGGRAVLGTPGGRARTVGAEALAEADPDVLVIAACGADVGAAVRDVARLGERAEWAALRAVRAGRVFVLGGTACAARPGPALVRSVEMLAAAIHGEQAGVDAEPEALRRVEAGRA